MTEETTQRVAKIVSTGPGYGRRVLLVDDEPMQLKLNRARLTAAGFVVHAVGTATRALTAARDLPPDLIVSDVLMGEVDGFNLCRMVRADPQLAGIPVVLVSAHFDADGDRRLAHAVGANDLVMRTPDFTAELDAIIRALTGESAEPSVRHAMDTSTSDLYGERVSAQLARQLERTRAAETRYQTLFENAIDAITLIDEHGTIVEVNQRWEHILGLPREQIVGCSIRDFAIADQGDANLARLKAVAAAGAPDRTRYAVRGTDGGIVWLEGNATATTVDGKPMVFAISRDITAAVEAEKRLALSEARYRSLVDNIPDMVWTATVGGTMTFVSGDAAKVAAFAGDEPQGPVLDAHRIHPADRDRVVAARRDFLAGAATFDIEYRRVRTDGTVIWVHSRANAPRLVDGEMQIDGVMTDISDRKRLESEMRQAQKMEAIGLLSGGIAHDFNNLLSVIMANCTFLLEAFADHDPRRADALEIEAAGHRAAALTRQLLAFSRRQALNPMLVDLDSTVAGLEKMLRRLIGEDVELSVARGEQVGAVRVDVGQIEQVVMNLVVNARDAMPDGGAMTIEVANADLDGETALDEIPSGRYVMVSVSDTGCGMDAETRRRIFEPFFTTKEIGKGTGLGLSTCYGIVRQSGGFIFVHSEVGRGTTFKVFLPRVDADATPVASQAVAALGGTETVLVIEDDDRVRAAVVRMLIARGYRVLSARTANEAVAVARAHAAIDLVLSDLILPGAPGTEAVEQLKSIAPAARALFMSGYTDHALLRSGAIADGGCFVQKPFTLDGLARKVREVLDRPSS